MRKCAANHSTGIDLMCTTIHCSPLAFVRNVCLMCFQFDVLIFACIKNWRLIGLMLISAIKMPVTAALCAGTDNKFSSHSFRSNDVFMPKSQITVFVSSMNWKLKCDDADDYSRSIQRSVCACDEKQSKLTTKILHYQNQNYSTHRAVSRKQYIDEGFGLGSWWNYFHHTQCVMAINFTNMWPSYSRVRICVCVCVRAPRRIVRWDHLKRIIMYSPTHTTSHHHLSSSLLLLLLCVRLYIDAENVPQIDGEHFFSIICCGLPRHRKSKQSPKHRCCANRSMVPECTSNVMVCCAAIRAPHLQRPFCVDAPESCTSLCKYTLCTTTYRLRRGFMCFMLDAVILMRRLEYILSSVTVRTDDE